MADPTAKALLLISSRSLTHATTFDFLLGKHLLDEVVQPLDVCFGVERLPLVPVGLLHAAVHVELDVALALEDAVVVLQIAEVRPPALYFKPRESEIDDVDADAVTWKSRWFPVGHIFNFHRLR